jgi:flagella basal body P-ring formation protein FlgA
MEQLKQTLRGAGVNLAMIRFGGPIQCMVSRSDVRLNEGDALRQWIAAHEPKTNQRKAEAAPAPAVLPATRPAPAAMASAGDSQRVEVQTLRQRLVQDLAQRLSLPADSIQMRFNPADDKVLNLATPQFKFNLEPTRVYNLGNVAWDVTIFAGEASQKAHIRADAFAWQQQVVLVRPLAYRQIIRPDDVVSRRTLVGRLGDEPLLTMDQVLGQQAARELKPGTVLTARMVEAVPLVRTGQLVTVLLSQGGVQIKTAGRAMENGAFGQTIRVRNEQTRDVYEAVVTGPQTTRLGGMEVAHGQ